MRGMMQGSGISTALMQGLGATVETREYLVGPALSIGAEGTRVLQLQEDLKTLGIDPGPLDGIYGPQTSQAVQTFQRMGKRTILVDGIVGPETRAKLKAFMLQERDIEIVAPEAISGNGSNGSTRPQGGGGEAIPWATILSIGGVAFGLALATYAISEAQK